ncbi:hypothetical protein ACRAKI_22395 [Saccharothrix isguenensis]
MDDAVIDALNYPAVLPGRSRRQLRSVDVRDLVSRIDHADLGFAVGILDHRGRLASRGMFRLLNWLPGTRLSGSAGRNYVVLKIVPDGQLVIDHRLRLRLPAALLRYCGMATGSSVMVVAVPDHNMLIIHPPLNVISMIRGFHAEQFFGMMRNREGVDDHE